MEKPGEEQVKNYLELVIKMIVAFIMGQTLFFKFSGAEESIYIFATIGIEPWGRYLTGMSELIAIILLFYPKTVFYGAALTFGIMFGAILSHFLFLGIEIQNDDGLLFGLALTALVGSCFLLYKNWKKGPSFLPFN